MLLSLEVKNFGSFKDSFKFLMKPGKTMSRFEDNVIEVGNKKISKVAVIVGENAGGKTNFITSLHYLAYLIKEDINNGTIPDLCYDYDNSKPQQFKIEIALENKIYTYILRKDKHCDIYEGLFLRPINNSNKKMDLIFSTSRKKLDEENKVIEMGLKLNRKYVDKEIEKLMTKGRNKATGLVVNKLYNLGIDIVLPFVDWINKKLIVKLPDEHSLNFYKQLEKNEEELRILKKEEFLDIFSLVDPSIIDIKIDEKAPFEDSKIIRIRRDGKRFNIKLKYDSSGVRDFFAWSVELWRVIYEDATLFADELDKVFNSILSAKVLNYVKVMSRKGQFIFSTHNILHINTVDFMKEQIYFINKNDETLSSEMYPLSDFEEYRYDKAKVYELYLKGLFGGVPNE